MMCSLLPAGSNSWPSGPLKPLRPLMQTHDAIRSPKIAARWPSLAGTVSGLVARDGELIAGAMVHPGAAHSRVDRGSGHRYWAL